MKLPYLFDLIAVGVFTVSGCLAAGESHAPMAGNGRRASGNTFGYVRIAFGPRGRKRIAVHSFATTVSYSP